MEFLHRRAKRERKAVEADRTFLTRRIDEISEKFIPRLLPPLPAGCIHHLANRLVPTHPYIKSKVNFSGGISPHVHPPARVLITPRTEQYIIRRHLLTLRGPIEK